MQADSGSHAATPMAGEKRRYPRAQVDHPVKLVRPDDSIHIAKLCDLSLEGLSLLADAVVIDNSFVVHIQLPQIDEVANQKVVLGCRLVHRTATLDADFYKLGMCIDDVTPNAATLLKQYLSYKLNYYLW